MGDNKTFADLFSDASSDNNKNAEDIKSDMFDNDSIQNENIEKENRDSNVFEFNEIFSDNGNKNIDSIDEDKEKKGVQPIRNELRNEEKKKDDDDSLNLTQNLFFDIEKNDSDVKNNEDILLVNEGNSIFFNSSHNNVENSESAIDYSDISNDGQESDFLEQNTFFDSKSNDNNQNTCFDGNSETLIPETKSFSRVKKGEKNSENISQSISPFFDESLEDDKSNFGELSKISLIEDEKNTKRTNLVDLTKSKHYSVKIVKKKDSLFKFILGVISYAIFIWLLFVGIVLLVYVLDIKIRAAKGDYSTPTFNAYVVLTGSMLPEIQVNDVVVTKKVDVSSLKVGDVITFASADTRFLNTIITHRIIKKEYDSKTKTYSFQTQGDNNNVADSALVPQNNIYGKVILKIPKLGYLQEFLASDGGWIIVILIPCLTVISYDIVKLTKGLKRKKYKNITIQK